MTTTQSASKQSKGQESSGTLMLIAIFKLLKGILLVAVGIGALDLLHRDVADTVSHWVDMLRVDPDNHFVHGVLSRLLSVNPNQLKAVSAGTFTYAGLLLTEGIGLLLRKRWAEYFTIITTAGLMPLEVWEITKHVTAIKLVVLLINAAIVVYLVARVRRSRAGTNPTPLGHQKDSPSRGSGPSV
jgi:uncharacterized membrane protein (DUF2068 family)